MIGWVDVDTFHLHFNLGLTLCLGETFTISCNLETPVRFLGETRPDWAGLNQFRTEGNQAEILAPIESCLALLVSKDPCARNGIPPETFTSPIPSAKLGNLNQGRTLDSP